MAPAERKKVVLKQQSSSGLENKTVGKIKSKESGSKGDIGRSKGEEARSLVASKEHEEAAEKVGNGEALAVKNSNNNKNNNIVSKNNNNVMERACSEDRGLRRRPKVLSFSYFSL